MIVAISNQEKKENKQHEVMAKKLISIRVAVNSKNPTTIAEALNRCEATHRTVNRFKIAIEWGIDGMTEDQIQMWKETKKIWEALQ